MKKKIITRYLANETATENLGRQLAAVAIAGTNIFLIGNLGAGKTTLVRGFLAGLGYTGAVKSPTYTLVESYNLVGQAIFHFDLYRIARPDELEFIGIREYFSAQAICLIEWPDHGEGYLPAADIHCSLSLQGDGRQVQLEANSTIGAKILQAMIEE